MSLLMYSSISFFLKHYESLQFKFTLYSIYIKRLYQSRRRYFVVSVEG